MEKHTFSVILFLFILPMSLFCQSSDFRIHLDEGQFSIEERMLFHKTPGISMAVIRNHELDTMVQWGDSDRENNQRVTENTLFQVGSMTTALAHFVVLRMVEAGKIDLDRDINEYLTSWKMPVNRHNRKNPITIRDLMLERRGFKTKSKPTGYAPGSKIPTLLQTLNGEAPSQEKAPCLKSNKNKKKWNAFYNRIILQQILEDVCQKPFAQIMQTEVLDPLEMKASTFNMELTDDQKATAAVGYDKKGKRIAGDRWIYPEQICAGLWTTPREYARFVNHILEAAKGKDNRFLSQEMAKQGLESVAGDSRSLIFYQSGKTNYWGGASMGFRTQMDANWEKGSVTVIFMNTFENWYFMDEVKGAVNRFIQTSSKKK